MRGTYEDLSWIAALKSLAAVRFRAEVDAKRQPVSAREADDIIDEAMRDRRQRMRN